MHEFPHHYRAEAASEGDGVTLSSASLQPLMSASPAEFGGPGDRWSPETLLVAAVADCFVLTFHSVARAAKLPWVTLRCAVNGTLDRVERVTQFTGFEVRATLQVPEGADLDLANRTLVRAEQLCLISNSLKGPCHLDANVEVVAGQPARM